MTTGKTQVASAYPGSVKPVQVAEPCKYGRYRRGRKFRRACCCVVFLLMINAMLLMHTARSVGAITWFVMNGSVTFKEDTFLFVPGGAKTFCNDFCVNMCIYGDVDCQLSSCLNSCNDKLEDDGDDSEFQRLAVSGSDSEDDILIDYVEDDEEDESIDVDMLGDQDPQEVLDQMQLAIEAAVEQLKVARSTYQEMCAADSSQFGCDLRMEALEELIEGVKEQMNAYDAFAVSFEVDIRVQVWMVDMDEITAEP